MRLEDAAELEVERTDELDLVVRLLFPDMLQARPGHPQPQPGRRGRLSGACRVEEGQQLQA